MKINLNAPMLDLNNQKIKQDNGKLFTLKDVCIISLLSNDESVKTGVEKMKRFLLSSKIQKANDLDLKAEEIVLLKDSIGKVYNALIVGRAYELLDL